MVQWQKKWMCGALIAAFGWMASGHSMEQKTSQPTSRTKLQKQSKLSGFYLGGFGGWGSNKFDVGQKGIAFYLSDQGGPLVVRAFGTTNSSGYGLGGIHFGYEWLNRKVCKWTWTPAVELEGQYFAQTKKAELDNPTDRLDFHEFEETFPMRVGVILANGLIAFSNNYLTPYAGVGLGAGIVSIHDAQAIQTEFPEIGLNHFNSNPNAFNWNFASQIKAGLRYSLATHMRVFAEYRFLFLAATTYIFGNTLPTANFPTHPATDDWEIRFDGIYNNIFVLGVDFPL